MPKVDKKARTTLIKSHLDRRGIDNFGRNRTLSIQQRDLFEQLIAKNRVVYAYRDGRDVRKSLYYYMGRDACQYNITEHLRENLERWREHVAGWMAESMAIKVSFKQLTTKSERTITDTLGQLGLSQRSSVYNPYQQFDRGAGRLCSLKNHLKLLTGTVKTTSTKPRKCEIGDWTNLFDNSVKAFFKKNAGALLKALGYEKDHSW